MIGLIVGVALGCIIFRLLRSLAYAALDVRDLREENADLHDTLRELRWQLEDKKGATRVPYSNELDRKEGVG